ncbi:hypothetical protein ECTW09195_6090 [Escherichia coli TW09195]|nr:hypothetical protein ECPA41_1415 [Escherichia coli PA41]EIO80507.1 hypothetical protein ECTW09195_6090 [Escherichia coli TW09195]EKH31165.1 hypothetical protein ECFRIK1997_6200 [Escherichia coli FRIK1997]EKV72995.1 hypothetical protein EC881467_5762 [Escherichia coli 88.1467]
MKVYANFFFWYINDYFTTYPCWFPVSHIILDVKIPHFN